MTEVGRPASRRPHVLVVAYYFPPLALSGVQRVTKFVKYLAEFGWQVTVLTARPGSYFAFDKTLASDLGSEWISVVRTRSFDPTRLFGAPRTVRMPRESRRRRVAGLSQWFFLPDNKVGWYPPAVRAAMKVHRKVPVDVVFASAPPYTAQLIGRKVAERTEAPLVIDLRDDWVGNPRHIYPTAGHLRIQTALERRVIAAADHICVINEPIARSIQSRAVNQGLEPAITIVPHGFDPDDFDERPREPTSRMHFLYTGVFYDAQSPEPFLRGLAKFLHTNPDYRSTVTARFAGLVPESFAKLVEALELEDVVEYIGYVPHAAITEMLTTADVLWMTVGRQEGAEGISTGKLFEYFGSRRPILGLVPEGTARDHLAQYGAGVIAEPDDVEGIADAIDLLHRQWLVGSLPVPDESFVRRFDRTRLTRQLIDIFEDVMGQSR